MDRAKQLKTRSPIERRKLDYFSQLIQRSQDIEVDVNVLRIKGKAASVSVVTGSWIGDQPNLFGLVGKGLLDACVCGEGLNGPSEDDVYLAITKVSNGDRGCVLILKRDQDQDAFTKGAIRAMEDSIEVKKIFVGDNCGLTPGSSPRRTCMQGIIWIVKVAGAVAANRNLPLSQIVGVIESASKYVGTLGVLVPKSLYVGKKIKLGIAMVGETGICLDPVRLTPLVEYAVDQIFYLTEKHHQNSEVSYSTIVGSSPECALMVSSLGPATMEEITDVVTVARNRLKNMYKLDVSLLFTGSYKTHLEDSGFCMSLMFVREMLNYLKEPANAPFWNSIDSQNISILGGNVMFQPPAIQATCLFKSVQSNWVATSPCETLRSIICGRLSRKCFWNVDNNNIATPTGFLQSIVRGILKLTLRLEEHRKYNVGLVSVYNICYESDDYENPKFVTLGAASEDLNDPAVYFEDLARILEFIRDEHRIDSHELSCFLSALWQSRNLRDRAKIIHHIFLYDVEKRIDFLRMVSLKEHIMPLKKKKWLLGDSGLVILTRLKRIPNYQSSRYRVVYEYIEPGKQECNYRDNTWKSLVSYNRNAYEHAEGRVAKIALYNELNNVFPNLYMGLFTQIEAAGMLDLFY